MYHFLANTPNLPPTLSKPIVPPGGDLEAKNFISRKFIIAICSLALLTILGAFAAKHEGIEGIYPSFVGGILGIISLYYTGNVLQHHSDNKAIVELKPTGPFMEEPLVDDEEDEFDDEWDDEEEVLPVVSKTKSLTTTTKLRPPKKSRRI